MAVRSPAAAIALSAGLFATAVGGGCVSETIHRGYIVSEMGLEQAPIGASREQVLLAMGTPSTTADFGGEVFYYISQRANRPVAFMNTRVVDQRVIAFYFDQNETVQRVADYGLQDGQVFDFVSRTTPTGGADFSFIRQIFSSAGRFSL